MGRWTPRPLPPTTQHRHGLTEMQEDLDDIEEDPPEVYLQRQVSRVADELQHGTITDPSIVARLERDLAYWRTALARTTVEEHWGAGEGDRPLF